MIKHFCDRCKKETKDVYVFETHSNSKIYELCTDCDIELYKFLKEAD